MNVRLLHETLLASAERVPEREAVVAGAERLAYAELLDRTLRLARALQELGVGRGDRVAIFMDNSAGCATAIYATLLAGGAPRDAMTAAELARHEADRVVGAHVSTDPTALALIGGMLPDETEDLTESQKGRLEELRGWEADGRGYLQIQSSRPQTLAYGLNDSPAAQLAWIVEKFKEWTKPRRGAPRRRRRS